MKALQSFKTRQFSSTWHGVTLIETGGCYGMEMNVEETKVIIRNNIKTAIPNADYERSKITGVCGI
jgi:hypothetical protein